MIVLGAVTPARLAEVAKIDLAHARKAIAMVHRGESIRPTSLLPRDAANAVLNVGEVRALPVLSTTASANDPFSKYLFGTQDGYSVEAVRIPLEKPGRVSVCVSSQVGCALACAFCATGKQGLVRNLAPWEIVAQVAAVRQATGRVHGVLFQGMGEPMSNLEAVLEAIAVFRDPCAFGIDGRAMTVSTAGLPTGIRKLAARAPHARLAISIGSFVPETRRQLLPITKAHSLEETLAAVGEHARMTGLAPMWAITLLAGVNDAVADAERLVVAARAFSAVHGIRPRISLIPYNTTGPDDPFQRSTAAAEHAFREVLRIAGLPHHKRYSGGQDVGAGCGQLAQIRRGAALI